MKKMETDKPKVVYWIRQDIYYHTCAKCPYIIYEKVIMNNSCAIPTMLIGCSRRVCNRQ